jgi:hypothetical protein
LTDPQLRDLGTAAAPEFRRTEPLAPAIPERYIAKAAEESVKTAGPAVVPMRQIPKIFLADRADGQDAFGIEPLMSLCAELAVHKNTEMPLCFGVLGAAGSGKSFALAKLGAAAEALSAQAKTEAASSHIGEIAVVRLDAAHLDGEPMTALAGALCQALHAHAPDIVEDALHSVRDPHAAISEAAERLDQAQRRLHQERDHLTEIESRRARLFDTLLYETPGSQVDAYFRSQRPGITSRLQAFGFSGDPVLNYKDLVASLTPVQGPFGKAGIFARALWSFKGQARLLLVAFFLVAIGLAIGWAVSLQDEWLFALRASKEPLASTAGWLDAHMDLFADLGEAAFIGAALAVGLNVWRAFRFLQPILRGAALLKAELANRRHEQDSALAHQTRRVDGLLAEVERAGRAHAEADQLAGKAAPERNALRGFSLFQALPEKTRMAQFVEALGASIKRESKKANEKALKPRRVFVLLDNLDAVAPARACEIIESLHRCLNSSAFVTAIALDPARLAAAGRDVPLEKWIQIPIQIEAIEKDHTLLVAQLLGRSPAEASSGRIVWDRQLTLDTPLSDEEEKLLIGLAPLAGRSARALKRFVNLYRLTRPLLPSHRPLLALMLALRSGGTPGEVAAMGHALSVSKLGAGLHVSQEQLRLRDALAVVSPFEPDLTASAVQQATVIADLFSLQ